MIDHSKEEDSKDNFKMFSRIYMRIINLAIRLKKLEWGEEFLEKFKDRLHNVLSKEMYNLGKAKFYYERKDLGKALDNLKKVPFKDTYCYAHGNILNAKIYYDQGYQDSLENVILNLRQFILRNKNVTGIQTDHIVIFLRYMTELVKIFKPDSDKNFIKFKLKKMLDKETEFFIHRQWFYEKIS